MVMAVLFFVLFTYSLLSDKIKEIRAKKNE
jgi:hypothetical protein